MSFYFFFKYCYIHAIKFLFRNNNFTSDFIFIATAGENKFAEKYAIFAKDEWIRSVRKWIWFAKRYDLQKGLI